MASSKVFRYWRMHGGLQMTIKMVLKRKLESSGKKWSKRRSKVSHRLKLRLRKENSTGITSWRRKTTWRFGDSARKWRWKDTHVSSLHWCRSSRNSSRSRWRSLRAFLSGRTLRLYPLWAKLSHLYQWKRLHRMNASSVLWGRNRTS